MQDSERHDIYSDLLTVIEPPLKGDNPAEAKMYTRSRDHMWSLFNYIHVITDNDTRLRDVLFCRFKVSILLRHTKCEFNDIMPSKALIVKHFREAEYKK